MIDVVKWLSARKLRSSFSLPHVDVLARYQATIDRQPSKAIGELLAVKANAVVILPTSPT
jgi:hypothetical protein